MKPLMRRTCEWLLAVTPSFAIQEKSADAVLTRAIEAAGGESALRGLNATRSAVTLSRPAQGQWPGAPSAWIQVAGSEIRDFASGRFRVDGNRLGKDTARFRMLVTPSVGYWQASYYVVPFTRDSLVARAREIRMSSPRVLLTALDGTCELEDPRSVTVAGRAATALRCRNAEAGVFHLRVDQQSFRLLATEYDEVSRVYGTRRVRLTFGAFRRVNDSSGGVVVPHQVEVLAGGAVRASYSYDRIEAAGHLPDSMFEVPRRARELVVHDRPIPVHFAEVSAGVEMIISDSIYRSMAVLHGDSITVIEAAETEHRMNAILDAIRARHPRRSVTAVVATHHHADHIAALPAVLDRGIPVLAHPGLAGLLQPMRELARRRRRHAGAIRFVETALTLGRGAPNEVQLHAASLDESAVYLVAYLPAQRLVFAADVWPDNPSLRSLIARQGWTVEHVATAHGPILPFGR